MGLLKHLLFWPVTGPQFLLDFSLRQVQGVVREELTDDTGVKSELLELQMLLELGDIDDAEFVRREADLMRRLREVREWRERFGMATPGGPVRVSRNEEEARPDAAATTAASERGPRVAEPGGASIDLDFGHSVDDQ